jgi:hypothetical protein
VTAAGTGEPEGAGPKYAVALADESYEWYRTAARRSRRAHRGSATAVLGVAAAIPVAAVVWPTNAVVPAILGAVIVVVSGLRAIFDWHDNYLRFSLAREAVEAQRRRYRTRSAPYDSPQTRDAELVAAITRIEQDEMANWMVVASDQPRQ